MDKADRIIAVGPLSDLKRNCFSGQSIMFDGTVEVLRRYWEKVSIVNIFPSKENAVVIRRMVDYIGIIFRLIIESIRTRRGIAYITSSLGNPGIYRDLIFLSVLRVSHHNVVLHQFGADISGIDCLKPISRRFFSWAMKSVSVIVIEGNYIESLLNQVPEVQGKLRIIPNGLPKEGINAKHLKTYNRTEPFRLFFLSNMIYSKGWFDVLQAVNLLVKKNRNVECLFAGRFIHASDDDNSIDYKQVFDDYVADNRLEGVVKYTPGLYGAEKDSAFVNANVFLLPSYYVNEGQPVSILEAMSYGCVPIVTEYRHIPMMVSEANGCFVRPQTPQDIERAICELMDNPDVYTAKSEKCIEDYQGQFIFDKYTSRIVSVIESASGHNNS